MAVVEPATTDPVSDAGAGNTMTRADVAIVVTMTIGVNAGHEAVAARTDAGDDAGVGRGAAVARVKIVTHAAAGAPVLTQTVDAMTADTVDTGRGRGRAAAKEVGGAPVTTSATAKAVATPMGTTQPLCRVADAVAVMGLSTTDRAYGRVNQRAGGQMW